MKKSLIALAVAAAIPAFAQAQASNVIMYGRVDLGYNKTSGGVLNQAQQSGSRFGVRGSENLGGDLFATFQVEHRFNADTGAQSNFKFWHGRSIVGLRGGFGEINLGHNYTPLFWTELAADPWGWDTVSNLSNTQGATQVRFSNSLEYVTPSLGGLQGRVMWAPSEVAGRKANFGFSGIYNAGPLYVGFGYEKHGYNSLVGTGTVANVVTPATTSVVSTLGGGVVTAGTNSGTAANNRALGLTATYNLGFMKLFANVGKTDVNPVTGLVPDTAIRTSNLSAAFPLGAGEFRATIGNKSSRTVAATSISAAKTRDFGFGYHHNLSNRTTLYADLNRGKNTSILGTTSTAVSATAYDFGLKHNF
jgi:predicted porin